MSDTDQVGGRWARTQPAVARQSPRPSVTRAEWARPPSLTLVKYEEAAWCLPKCEFPHWSRGPRKPAPGSRRHSRAASGGRSGADWGGRGSPHRASPALSPGARHRGAAATPQSAWDGAGRARVRTTARVVYRPDVYLDYSYHRRMNCDSNLIF